MKKNILIILLFVSFSVVVFYLPVFVLKASREFFSVKKVITIQKDNPEALFGYSYNGESDLPFKRELIAEVSPKIMVVGVSRSMQIRKEFFIGPETFVNAAVPRPQLGNLRTIQYFVDDLSKNASGTVIFLGLDSKMFTRSYLDEDNKTEKSILGKFLSLPGINIRRIYLDYLSKKFSLDDIVAKSKSSSSVGFSALLRGSGYRSDGSYKDGEAMKRLDRLDSVKDAIGNEIVRIKRMDASFVDTSMTQSSNFSDLAELLLDCKKKGIQVYGFLNPDPFVVYSEKMKKDSLFKKSEMGLVDRISLEFRRQGFVFIDTSDISKFGGKDSEFMDAEHGTDLLYAKMFVYLQSNEPLLKGVINRDFLEKSIKKTKGDFLSF